MTALLKKLTRLPGAALLVIPIAVVPVLALLALGKSSSKSTSKRARVEHDRRRRPDGLRDDDTPVEPVLGPSFGNGHTHRRSEGSFEEF